MIAKLQLEEVTQVDPVLLEQLSELLVDVVEEGASIGFLPPLSKESARDYWEGVLEDGVILWIAKEGDRVGGTVQLHLSQKANGTHRAEVAKLMVHPLQRQKGIGKALMTTLEDKAKSEGRSLLILDTRLGDPSNIVYRSLGYVEAGSIPRFAKSANGDLDATLFFYKEI
ncbi:GNAT family N-acetyltransferase [Paenibacillus sp. GCM10012307]|uniref:GNAT family N-acetyltransferase n=1 Tax=Paenibacillus roseus TaxID=2798579 RepID=A0A934J4P4_9BACL|nr:GNAT family N-acetyltransferase [Paenibacillus roseus]MBJ6360365.1 GNAT family N-acetyltransferase [Paenibacillus roseus]